MKIRPVGAELFHADRRTDSPTDRQTDMKIYIRSSQFYNAPKEGGKFHLV